MNTAQLMIPGRKYIPRVKDYSKFNKARERARRIRQRQRAIDEIIELSNWIPMTIEEAVERLAKKGIYRYGL